LRVAGPSLAALVIALLLSPTSQAGLPASPDLPPDDPLARDALRLCLRYGDLCPGYTTRPLTRMEVARMLDAIDRQWGPAQSPVDRRRRARLAAALGPELAWVRGGRGYGQVLLRPVAEARLEAGYAAGGDPYPLHGGDAAGPFLGVSWTSELVAGPLVAVVEPRLALVPVGGGNAPAGPLSLGGPAVLDMPRGYIKLGGAGMELTAGISDWAWGVSRGGLIWSGNAAPPLTIRFTQPRTWSLPWIFRYLGQFRVTGLWAHLLGPRDDVADPNLLAFKIDYRPIPWIEASFTRLSMYGGEGRPKGTPKDFWQLFWATNPHTTISRRWTSPSRCRSPTTSRSSSSCSCTGATPARTRRARTWASCRCPRSPAWPTWAAPISGWGRSRSASSGSG